MHLKQFMALRTEALQDAHYFIARMPNVFHDEYVEDLVVGDAMLWKASISVQSNGSIMVRWDYENTDVTGWVGLEFSGDRSYTLQYCFGDENGIEESQPIECNITVPIPDEVVERIKIGEVQNGC